MCEGSAACHGICAMRVYSAFGRAASGCGWARSVSLRGSVGVRSALIWGFVNIDETGDCSEINLADLGFVN